jgi:ABC-type multidrug transport system fused ATPase/permease subunit
VLVSASVAAGLAEATILTLLAEVAAAMVTHAHRISAHLGPARLDVGIGRALTLALIVAVIRLLLGLVIAYLPARVSSEVQAALRRKLFGAYTRASWAVQSNDREGSVQELMTSQITQAMGAVMQIVTAMSGGAMFFALVVASFAVNPLVAVIILGTAIVLFGMMRPLSRRGRRAGRELSQASMNHAAGVSEVVRLGEESHVFGAAEANRRRIYELVDASRRAIFNMQLTTGLVIGVYQSLVMLLIVAGLTGLYVTSAGNVAALGAVVLMLVRSTSYAQQFQAGFQAINQVLPFLERIDGAVERYTAGRPISGNRPMPHIERLEFANVSFSYRRDRPALRGVSFSVKAGEAIGIVGPSGAGKSTLIQLLLRLREPDEGYYMINHIAASSFNRKDWQRRVAYVAQEPRIMRATVADNIRFFRDLDDAAVEHAARLAHIHDEIMSLPHGYDTVIGQVSDAVSGGQRQRICIARALAGEPDILVLDEPTSALDSRSEAAVQASLTELQGRVTLLIAAHRISTLTTCDRLLVLADGTVQSFAPTAEAMQSHDLYRMTAALAGDAA